MGGLRRPRYSGAPLHSGCAPPTLGDKRPTRPGRGRNCLCCYSKTWRGVMPILFLGQDIADETTRVRAAGPSTLRSAHSASALWIGGSLRSAANSCCRTGSPTLIVGLARLDRSTGQLPHRVPTSSTGMARPEGRALGRKELFRSAVLSARASGASHLVRPALSRSCSSVPLLHNLGRLSNSSTVGG